MTLFYADRKDPFGIDINIDVFVRRPVKDIDVEGAAGRAGIGASIQKETVGALQGEGGMKKALRY